VSDQDAIAEGRQAWRQIRSRALASWNDWLSVGHALVVARAIVMRETGTNKPVGGKYNVAMGAWLRGNGFDGINTQERHNAVRCAENEAAIEAWRETLTEVQRRKYQSASCVLNYWKRATRPKAPACLRGPNRVATLEKQIELLQGRIRELEALLADHILGKDQDYGSLALTA
jgi:hypothetical protein